MSLHTYDLIKWNRRCIWSGAIVWLLMVLARLLNWILLDELKLILLLALAVITPLAIPLLPLPHTNSLADRLARLVLLLQPLATLIGATSLLLDRGLLAANAAVVWLLYTGLIALIGLLLLLQSRGRQLTTICLAAAFIYLPIGAIWLLLDRLGMQPLAFSQTTVLLTAVHFHFITLAALIITGLTGRAIQQRGPWNFYRVLAGCMLINPLLVAAGITLTRVSGNSILESSAAYLLALCMLLIALCNLRLIIPTTSNSLARGLLLISSSAVIFTMLLVAAYVLGEQTGIWTITIPQMIQLHGWINALIFGLCGLLGWRVRLEQGKA